ncbi:MAG: hypothetical protein AAGI90_02325 [Chlamydiota bacterium]
MTTQIDEEYESPTSCSMCMACPICLGNVPKKTPEVNPDLSQMSKEVSRLARSSFSCRETLSSSESIFSLKTASPPSIPLSSRVSVEKIFPSINFFSIQNNETLPTKDTIFAIAKNGASRKESEEDRGKIENLFSTTQGPSSDASKGSILTPSPSFFSLVKANAEKTRENTPENADSKNADSNKRSLPIEKVAIPGKPFESALAKTSTSDPKAGKFFLLELLNNNVRHAKISGAFIRQAQTLLEKELESYKKFALEIYPETLVEYEKKEATTRAWNQFFDVLEYVGTSLLILTGIALITSGAETEQLYGWAILGAGTVGGLNHAAGKMRVWDSLARKLAPNDQEKQAILAHGFEFGITLFTSIAGVLIGVAAIQASALTSLPTALERFLEQLLCITRITTEPLSCKAEVDRIKKQVELIEQEVLQKLFESNASEILSLLESYSKSEGKDQEVLSQNIERLVALYHKISQI